MHGTISSQTELICDGKDEKKKDTMMKMTTVMIVLASRLCMGQSAVRLN